MSLMIERSRSSSSRFDCSTSKIVFGGAPAVVSATWVWPIGCVSGERSMATSALNDSSVE